MHAPTWLPSLRWLRSFRGFEVLSFLLFCSLLFVGIARGWYRVIPGLGPVAHSMTAEDHRSDSDSEGDDHEDDHHAHEHSGRQGHAHGEHAGHAHEEEEHDESSSIELSEQARRTLRLRTSALQPETFWRRVSVPATIVDWPGRTHVYVSAPLTGTVTAIHVARGETVSSGEPLYTLRLTHQDLVRTQAEFLQTLGKTDVEQREVERLAEVARSGAIAKKSLLERQYELDKLQAELRAQRETLLLHGLSESQVEQIEQSRQLIREVMVEAPTLHADWSLHDDALAHPQSRAAGPAADHDASAAPSVADGSEHVETQFVVTELTARRGQSVETGQPLTLLADYEHLYAEGRAFQQDAESITEAMSNEWPVQAVFETGDQSQRVLDDLEIVYVAGEVGIASRALPFYVPLTNEVIQREQQGEHTYTTWRFKPGQRLQLRVPVARLEGVFVLPVDAIVKQGVEQYIFIDKGGHFARRPVHVVMQDQMRAAVANDGSIRSGEKVVLSGAHQLQLALKNKASGSVDPHAGHGH